MGPGAAMGGNGEGAEAAWWQNRPIASCGRRRYMPFLSSSGIEQYGQDEKDRLCDNFV